MNNADLLKSIEAMPDDAPIFVDCEGGVDFARSASLVSVLKKAFDWRNTPVGNYRFRSDEDTEFVSERTTGASFDVILISMDQQP
jgi:hypothetical protein